MRIGPDKICCCISRGEKVKKTSPRWSLTTNKLTLGPSSVFLTCLLSFPHPRHQVLDAALLEIFFNVNTQYWYVDYFDFLRLSSCWCPQEHIHSFLAFDVSHPLSIAQRYNSAVYTKQKTNTDKKILLTC